MAEKKNTKRNLDYPAIIKAAVVLIVGILFCCSNALGTKALSILLGIGMILSGLAILIPTIATKKSLLTNNGIVGSAFIALGILSMIDNFVGVILAVIPWILIAVGVVAIADAMLLILWRKGQNRALFAAELIIGIIFVTLGICLITVNGFASFAGVVFGVALIVYAAYTIVGELSNKK